MNVFGMVTTRASQRYTHHALESFFAHTDLSPDEKLVLIDNDGDFALAGDYAGKVELIRNSSPKSFAANANMAIAIAREKQANLYFLNNDLIFSPHWIDALQNASVGICSPLCNQQIQYHQGDLLLERSMELESYLNHRVDFHKVISEHQRLYRGYQPVLSLAFFCVKLSIELLQRLGDLDLSFGRGGAEDNDYCLRAILAGFPVQYALSSYVLHFSGKSTWSGAESKQDTEARVQKYSTEFECKWGVSLKRLILDFDDSVLRTDSKLTQEVERGNLRRVVEMLLAHDTQKLPALKIEASHA